MDLRSLILGFGGGLAVGIPLLVWVKCWPGPFVRLARAETRLPLTDLVWRPFAPNWITVWSLVVTLAAFFAVFLPWPIVGIAAVAFGGFLDSCDGSVARACGRSLLAPRKWYHRRDGFLAAPTDNPTLFYERVGDDSRFGRWWFEMNFAGGTDLGKVLDPFCDKVKIFAMYAYFAGAGLLWWPLVLAAAVPDAVNTLGRRPFSRFGAGMRTEGAATLAGKVKHPVQWLPIVSAGLAHTGWLGPASQTPEYALLSDALLGLSAILGFWSMLSRLRRRT